MEQNAGLEDLSTEEQRAREYGFDLSLYATTLAKSPEMRLRDHDKALNAALELRDRLRATRDG